MRFNIEIKCDTGGHFDYDGCSYLLATNVNCDIIPRIGEHLEFYWRNCHCKCQVTDVCHIISPFMGNGSGNKVAETTVYIIPTNGWSVKDFKVESK